MSRTRSVSIILFVLLVAGTLPFLIGPRDSPLVQASSAADSTYLGFDRNLYPGDDALPVLRNTFAFAGYWLSPPPGEKINTWYGKRELLHSHGFGFAVLYRGRDSKKLKTEAEAKQKGAFDAHNAVAAARTEGFAPHTIVFLDIEEGGRLPAAYHAYLRAWANGLASGGYRAGVYCSGMPVSEGAGATIVTSDDIRSNIGAHEIAYWVYNDACPPSPGCGVKPPPVSASGLPYAAIWQFAQSPRRKEFSARCAATYYIDGNCYAPGDTARAYFLDVNSATSPDPSGRTQP